MKKSNMFIAILASGLMQFCGSNPEPTNQGTINNPIDITNQIRPYSGSVATASSYYVIRGATGNLVTISGQNADVDLYVYDTGSFAGANLVCSGMNTGNNPEKCYGVGNPDLFIEVDGSVGGNTAFNISW